MAKKMQVLAASARKVCALFPSEKRGAGTIYWAQHGEMNIIGTRHWLVCVHSVDSVMRAALAGLGLYEAGKAWNNSTVITAPDVARLIPDSAGDPMAALTDTRLTYNGDGDMPTMRLLSSVKGFYVVNNDYYVALAALFPFSPMFVRGQMISFGDERVDGFILPFRVTNNITLFGIRSYLKGDFAEL